MDRSMRRSPDPVAGAARGERRRSLRQKLYTPVYASFSGPHTGLVVDLSELLDLNEDGFAVQTGGKLETNRAVTLCLDLPETKSYVHGNGQVVWSDDAGRSGIRFSALPESSRKILKEWLFANLLIASSHHDARAQQLAHSVEEQVPEPATMPMPIPIPIPMIHGRVVSTSAAVSTGNESPASLEAVRHRLREMGVREIDDDDLDAILQVVTERALTLTGATGAALALLTNDTMLCRARAGEPAPPLGAPVDIQRGLSGECVRSGLPVSCDDMENDGRVDPEIARGLGIGSLLAAPIVSDFRVVGVLEVFSPQPHSFTAVHRTLLDRLVEMIPRVPREKDPREKNPRQNPHLEESRQEVPATVEAGSLQNSAAIDLPQPPLLESGATDWSVTESSSISTVHQSYSERQRVPEESQSLSKRMVPEQVPELFAESLTSSPSRLIYKVVLWLAILAVALVLGYLFGPSIQKRWAGSALALQRVAAAGEKTAHRSSADRGSADQPVQLKSLADLQKLADQGDAESEWQMGVRYHNGEGVPHDDAQAMQWFLRAAEQGHVDAQSHLGAYFWAGRGVPEDLSKAYLWSAIAMAHGDEISKARLEGLASQMTQEQVSAARQQAEAWIRQHDSVKTVSN